MAAVTAAAVAHCSKAVGRLLQLRQERLSRRPRHDRKFERRESAEPRQDLGVLLLALAEAEPRVDGDARPIHARAHGAMHGCVQILPNGPDHIFDGRQLGPGFRRAAHVRDDQPGVMLGRDARQLRIERQAGWIVDNLGAVFQRLSATADL